MIKLEDGSAGWFKRWARRNSNQDYVRNPTEPMIDVQTDDRILKAL